MQDKEIKRRRTRYRQHTYSLREVRDMISDLSHGGHPDHFIPSNAKVALTRRGRIRLEWKV